MTQLLDVCHFIESQLSFMLCLVMSRPNDGMPWWRKWNPIKNRFNPGIGRNYSLCMPPTSLRLRPGLILIQQLHLLTQGLSHVHTKPPDLRRGKILLVTNQKITTTNGNSCTSRQPANGALTMFQLIHISSLAFFQCTNGVICWCCCFGDFYTFCRRFCCW